MNIRKVTLVPYVDLPSTPERTESWVYRQFPLVQDLYAERCLQVESSGWWKNWKDEISICLEESMKE